MIYIQVNDDDRVSFVHYMPFDAVNGLGKTREQLEQEGILVDSIPEPEPGQIEGKQPILYCNPNTKKLWYEYEDVPKTQEETQKELNSKLLKDSANMQIELDNQKELNSKLLLQIAKLGGDINA